MKSLLPKNATRLELALEETAVARFERLEADFLALGDPDTCPPPLLPYLAWATGVEIWDEDFVGVETPDELVARRRAIIKRFSAIRQLRGTLAAINMAMEAIGVKAEIREWWDNPVHQSPYTFRVVITNKNNAPIGEDERRRILRIIDSLKPLRARYDLDILFETEAIRATTALVRVTRIKRLTLVLGRD